MMLNKKTLVFISLLLGAQSFARPYRHYLDPMRAEQTLAGIALRPRLSEREWSDIIHGQKNQNYAVKPGDNLWNISKRLFGDAWLWRKMWQVNQGVTNPHELDVGRILAYYSEDKSSEWKIPVVKLVPDGRMNANDLDTDRFINVDIKQRHRVSHFVLTNEALLGEVSGSFSPREGVGLEDHIYLRFFDESQAKVGESYLLVHEARTINDFSAEGNLISGKLMQVVGEVKLTVPESGLVRAEVKGMFQPVRRGDKIVSMQKTVSWSAALNPPTQLTARVVLGENPENKMFGQGGLILLNKGEQDGMKPGYLFRVYQDTDPVTESTKGVSPYFKGEVQIVFVNQVSSLGYILRNTDPIFIGDTVIPRQAIDDPAPPATHPNDTVEID